MRTSLRWVPFLILALSSCKACGPKDSPDSGGVGESDADRPDQGMASDAATDEDQAPPMIGDLVVEVCDNGADDDDDGLVDCDQLVCQLSTHCVEVPGDPVAPPTPNGGFGDFADSVRFLWEGDGAVIRGLDPSALDAARVSVIRGVVTDRDGNPVSGIHASIAGEPRLGYTYSRANGEIDLVANGDQEVVVRWQSSDHPAVDRIVDAPALAFAHADPIVVTRHDTANTEVDLTAGGTHTATLKSDTDGERAVRLYFPPGAFADIVLPTGSRTTLARINVRATEFTVDTPGMAAMPADLPETTAYTWAAELTVDEARAVGSTRVEFHEPVVVFLDNFLDVEPGTVVPNGLYDRTALEWEAANDGVVAQLVEGGLDVDGDGQADDDTALLEIGFPSGVAAAAAELFADGDTFWMAPVEHFTPCDLNFPYEFPDGAVAPDEIPEFPSSRHKKPCPTPGSSIECQNQVLGKSLPLPGSELQLTYRSDRVVGSGRAFEMNLTRDSVNQALEKITVSVEIAGRLFREEFVPAENLTYRFEWDGLDAYGRETNAETYVRVRIGYWYEVQYTAPTEVAQSFGQSGDGEFREGRLYLPILSRYAGKMGSVDSRSMFGLAGWQLSSQHGYDGRSRALHLAGQPKREASNVGRVVRNFETFEDDRNTFGFDIWGTAQTSPRLFANDDGTFTMIVTVPDADGARAIWRREVDGSWTHVAGRSQPGDTDTRDCLISGDCGAADAREGIVTGLRAAVGPNQDVYVANGRCVWEVSEGALREAAGDCLSGEYPDDSDNFPHSLAIAASPSGRVFVGGGEAIVEIFPGEKRFEIVAGGCSSCDDAVVGGPAVGRNIGSAGLVTATSDAVYFAGEQDDEIKRIDGNGNFSVVYSDPESSIRALSAAPSGDIYFLDARGFSGLFLMRLRPDGGVETIAGASSQELLQQGPGALRKAQLADGVSATSALLSGAFSVSIDRDGRAYYIGNGPIDDDSAPTTIPLIKVIEDAFGGSIADDEVLVPSQRATHLHKFDRDGRILETRHALTGVAIRTFEYDAEGRLASVTDADVGRLTIERDASGAPTAIIGEGGLRTELTVDASGHLAAVRYPDGTGVNIVSDQGRITSWLDPVGIETTYEYDPLGRLTRMEDAVGGWKNLTRLGTSVRLETSSGRTKEFGLYSRGLFGSSEASTVTDAHGLSWTTESLAVDGTVLTTPDGTVVRREVTGDPRFGPQSLIATKRSTKTPSGIEQTMTRTRDYSYSDPADRRTVTSQTDVVTINGNATTEVWDVAARTRTVTTPAGRTYSETFDDQGRPISRTAGSFDPLEYDWHDDGRLAEVRHGTQWVRWNRNTSGFVTGVSTSGGDDVNFTVDAVGRPLTATRAGLSWTYDYDDSGQLTSLGAPGASPTVDMTWDIRQLAASAEIPGAGDVLYQSNVDGVGILRASPSGRAATTTLDAKGLPTDVGFAERAITRVYDTATGQVTRLTTDETSIAYSWDGFLVTDRRQTVGPADVTVTREFDDSFRVVRRSIAAENIDYAFDLDGLKTAAGGMTITRGAAGEPTETEIGTVRHEVDYDSMGRTTSERYFVGANLLYSWALTFDTNGRVDTVTEVTEGATTSIEYDRDALSRIIAVRRDSAETESYAWENEARRTMANGATAAFDADGRLATQGSLTVSYDGDGNVSSLADSAGETRTFEHDTLANLVNATTSAGTSRFIFDAQDKLVGIEVDGAFQRGFIYDDDSRPVAQVNASGNLDAVFVYATRVQTPDVVRKNGRDHRVVTDWRGSVRLVVDAANGTIVQRRSYDEFGVELAVTAPDFQPFGYAGGLDLGLGSVWAFPARAYAAETGRWLQPDPTGLGGGTSDLWSYAAGDPVTFIDPEGEAIWVPIVLAAIVLVPASVIHDFTQTNASDAMNRFAEENNHPKGSHNGPGDAIKHCALTCENTRAMGSRMSMRIGDLNESEFKYKLKGEKNPEDEKHMDESNNHCGDYMAQEYPDEPCYNLCENAYWAGDLIVMPEGTWSGNWFSGS